MTGGRPLRFLAMALGGWTMIRIAFVLSDGRALPVGGAIPAVIRILVPDAVATVLARTEGRPRTVGRRIAAPIVAPIFTPSFPFPARARTSGTPERTDLRFPAPPPSPPPEWKRQIVPLPSPFAPPARVRDAKRLNGSAWLLVRGGPAGTVSGGQLGASQGGVRLTYALGGRRRFALAARLAAPLQGKGREAALGVEWRPTTLPIRLIAEQRFVLDGGRGGPTLGIIAGYGPADIAPGVRIEAYGQAGIIARDGVEKFVDASARITHPLGHVAGARIDIGVGIWGSAQRGTERLDIGPSLVVGVPIAGKSLRLTLDWRERVAGAARPGSGPALSIGSDF
ncbi:hypothetical protein [Sphingomonas sp. PP-CE-1G-424]|uniref:hypothetical protein n=1 Tax=Sphingomonas sp. PP-CE-1G-424 TaxID=2135658 RepID=UPI0010562946|nr:hypothetical protein [Sphingomonas sp. PP-CE-1G-424]TCP73002.1 hypothetical protein C8J43_101746 [Sphingomonas sp. PP-CE-1G-424]